MNAADEFIARFMAANGDGPFSSMDELQTSLSQFQNQENSRSRSEFLGLSSEQVFRLRGRTIDEMPDIVKLHFDEQQSEYGGTPVIVIALAIMLAIRQNEFLKATAKGNLPRKAVRFIFENVSGFLAHPGDGQPSREEDVYHIFKVRILLQRAGIISLRKGRFTLSRKGQDFFDDFADTNCAVKLYRHLLLFFAHKFNWLFNTRFHEELAELQHCVLFGLFILHKKARSFTHEDELAGYFAKAFPIVLDLLSRKAHPEYGLTPEKILQHGFGYLFLGEFCWFFGLVLQRKVKGTRDILDKREYRTSDLFNSLFRWKQ